MGTQTGKASAIRNFINSKGLRDDLVYQKASMKEIKEFKEACSEEEWSVLAQEAAELLAVID